MTQTSQPTAGDRRTSSPDYEQALRDLLASFDSWFIGAGSRATGEDTPTTGGAPTPGEDFLASGDALRRGRMTQDLYPYTALFSPIQVNSLTLKNRLVMGPMGNVGMADELGRPSQRMIRYFVERAQGGVGLITSGLVPVSQGIDPSVTEVGDRSLFPRLDSSRTVFPPWRELAQAIHSHGARFFVQLTPGLGRVGSPECLVKKHRPPVSASWNPSYYMPQVPCRPLTDRECRRIIGRAGQAAADAQALTIDGVYLHGHEGYLLEQMTNPAFNRRKLGRYACGHAARWQAFGVELVQEIRRRTGPRYPLMYRIDLSLALNATYGERMSKVGSLRKFRRERTVGQTLDYMAALVRAGVDMFDVDLGCYDNWWLPHPPGPLPPGLYLGLAKIVKDDFASPGPPLQRRAAGAGRRGGQARLSRPGRERAARRAVRPGDAGPAAAGRSRVARQGLRRQGGRDHPLHRRPGGVPGRAGRGRAHAMRGQPAHRAGRRPARPPGACGETETRGRGGRGAGGDHGRVHRCRPRACGHPLREPAAAGWNARPRFQAALQVRRCQLPRVPRGAAGAARGRRTG